MSLFDVEDSKSTLRKWIAGCWPYTYSGDDLDGEGNPKRFFTYISSGLRSEPKALAAVKAFIKDKRFANAKHATFWEIGNLIADIFPNFRVRFKAYIEKMKKTWKGNENHIVTLPTATRGKLIAQALMKAASEPNSPFRKVIQKRLAPDSPRNPHARESPSPKRSRSPVVSTRGSPRPVVNSRVRRPVVSTRPGQQISRKGSARVQASTGTKKCPQCQKLVPAKKFCEQCGHALDARGRPPIRGVTSRARTISPRPPRARTVPTAPPQRRVGSRQHCNACDSPKCKRSSWRPCSRLKLCDLCKKRNDCAYCDWKVKTRRLSENPSDTGVNFLLPLVALLLLLAVFLYRRFRASARKRTMANHGRRAPYEGVQIVPNYHLA